MPRVLGIDGSPDGWVGIVLDGARTEVVSAPKLADLIASVEAGGALACVGIDIPIGLPFRGARAADLLAQQALGSRRSSLFVTPIRAGLMAETYEAGVRAARDAGEKGFSRQAYGLRTKVFEAEQVVITRSDLAIREVHPELSFTVLAGHPAVHGKKTWAGARERTQLLADQGIVVGPDLPGSSGKAGVDDVLDAAAAAWTARRCATGKANAYPDPPEPLTEIDCAIWA